MDDAVKILTAKFNLQKDILNQIGNQSEAIASWLIALGVYILENDRKQEEQRIIENGLRKQCSNAEHQLSQLEKELQDASLRLKEFEKKSRTRNEDVECSKDKVNKISFEASKTELKNKTAQELPSVSLNFVFDMMCCRIGNWQVFANALGVDYLIRDLLENEKYNEVHEKIYKCIHEKRETAVDADPDWFFWRNILLEIGEGILVDDIEDRYPNLLKDGRIDISNTVHKAFDAFGILAHDAIRKELFEKLPMRRKDKIGISVGAGTRQLYASRKVQDMPTLQDSYFEKYKVLENIKIYDFSNIEKIEECKILQTIHTWLQNNNDKGFCIKGYDVKQHVKCFYEGYCDDAPYKDSYILTYSEINNTIFYVDTAPLDIKKSMRRNRLNIRDLRSVNQCLDGKPFVYIPVTLYNSYQLEVVKEINCKTCIDLELVVSSAIFENIKLFENWWGKIAIEVKDITDEQNNKSDISNDFLKSIIGFMAIAPFNLPNFTNSPEKEIHEAQKLIMLTPEQQHIIYSKRKRKIIKGSFGSGKTIVAQELIKLVEKDLSEFDFVYYMIHDHNSIYVQEMGKLAESFGNKNVIVCKISDIIGDTKSLSSIFQYLLNTHENHPVHVFIEEFNGEILDEEEVNEVTLLLKNKIFKNSNVVIVCQSMESDRYQIVDEDYIHFNKYQFEKLSEQADFKIFDLSYLLRSSEQINKLVDVAIPILNGTVMKSVMPKLVETRLDQRNKIYSNLKSARLRKTSFFKSKKDLSVSNNPEQNTVTKKIAKLSVKISDTDQLLKYFTVNSNQYQLKIKLESSYKFVGNRNTAHVVKGNKPVMYFPFSQEKKGFIFQMPKSVRQVFKKESHSYSQEVYCLSKVLKKIEFKKGKDKQVIICMNSDSKNLLQDVLDVNQIKWTDDPQLLSSTEYQAFLTDYTLVRGCEFLNVVLILSIDENHLKHNLIDCLNRCVLNLLIIVVNKRSADTKLGKIVDEWVNKNLVEVDEENHLSNITQEKIKEFNDANEHLLIKDTQKQIVDVNAAEVIHKLYNKSQLDTNENEDEYYNLMDIEDWLDGPYSVYINNFKSAGYDDTTFLVGLKERELLEIGIKNRAHRKKILTEIERLPPFEFKRDVPEDVYEWLVILGLDEYWPFFQENSYTTQEDFADLILKDTAKIASIFHVMKSAHLRKLISVISLLNLPSLDKKKEVATPTTDNEDISQGYRRKDCDADSDVSDGYYITMDIEDWLDGPYSVYINHFKNAGYDDTSFLFGMKEAELLDIGIINRAHRKKILAEIERLPPEEFAEDIPEDVFEWLLALGLEEYWPLFEKNSYTEPFTLVGLKHMDIASTFKVTKPGHLKKLFQASLFLNIQPKKKNLLEKSF